jgi:hypothetical protein
MKDDEDRLFLSSNSVDVIIAEVKTNQPCSLNGPWTRSDHQNVHRVLAAIGCLPQDDIEKVAAEIYQYGTCHSEVGINMRLVAIGREHNENLHRDYPQVPQLIWPELLSFMWNRFHKYRSQKKQADQWEEHGKRIKELADRFGDKDEFTNEAMRLMSVERPRQNIE